MTPAKEVVAFLLVKIPFLSVCCTRGNLNARFQSIPLSLSLYSLNFFKQISLRSDYSNAIFYLLINYTRYFFFCHPKFSGSRSNTYFVSFLEISNFNDAYRTSWTNTWKKVKSVSSVIEYLYDFFLNEF